MDLNFDAIKAALMPRARFLVEEWLPGGKWEGEEYVVRNPTRADRNPGSFKINATKGVFQEFAEDGTPGSGGDLIALNAYLLGIDNVLSAKMLIKRYIPAMREPEPAKAEPAKTKPKPRRRKSFPPPPIPPPPIPPPPTEPSPSPSTGDPTLVFPVPEDAPPIQKEIHREHGFPVKVWECRDADGNLLCGSARFESKDKDGNLEKVVLPLTFWSDGRWHWKGWPAEAGNGQPLYGLQELAAAPTDRVWVVEGEKCWDALRATGRTVVTWHGGSKRVFKLDLSSLHDRELILWPDNDMPGIKSMKNIAKLLQGKAAMKVVQIPKGKDSGWDCADALEEGFDIDSIEFKNIDKAMEQPGALDSIKWPFRFLGYDHGTYYYHPAGQNQVIDLAARNHTKSNLIALAPLEFWESAFEGSKGVQWDMAMNAMIRMQEQKGVYDKELIRGRGVWRDDGRMLLHTGNKIEVDGTEYNISEVDTRYIYENRPAIKTVIDDPMDKDEAFEVVDLATEFTWEDVTFAKYLVGWLALSSICGALPWRSSIWLTGPSGSGKSWITTNVVAPIVGPLAIFPIGETTAAGIRQTVKHDAIPVVFDEAEAEDQNQQQRIQTILSLVRQSSSDSGGKIYKGTAGGSANDWTVRSMFYFSSIGTGTHKHADENRVSIVKLKKDRRPDKDIRFEKLSVRAEKLLTTRYCSRWRSRAFHNIDKILKCTQKFSRAISVKLGSKRTGDQVGSLLAGWWMMENDEVVTDEEARIVVDVEKFSDEQITIERSDEHDCLSTLLQKHIRVRMSSGTEERSIGELILESVEEYDTDVMQTLLRYGIKVDIAKECVYICGYSNPMMELLRNTQWALNYHLMLQRIEGVKKINRVKFLPGFHGSAAEIPLDMITGGSNEEES